MPDSLRITLRARTDAATPVNLTYHPYFNLAADARMPATAPVAAHTREPLSTGAQRPDPHR